MLVRRAELAGRIVDLRIVAGAIAEIAASIGPAPEEEQIDARGGALLPGLHDHHIHLLALAADASSLRCGPPAVRDRGALESALRAAARELPVGAWLRGTGYHESVAGPLERKALDALVPDRPLRVQHRSGALWMLNTRAIEALGPVEHPGAERDETGHPTGRFFRLDALLRERLAGTPPPLASIGVALASCGVTGVSDATVDNDAISLAAFAAARRDGSLPQRIVAMGGPSIADCAAPGVEIGPVKIVLDERRLPAIDDLRLTIEAAHATDRPVAVHCVTRSELALALRCIEDAGPRPGDRIEHAAVSPPELASWLAKLGLTVVTQHNFLRERGDAYLSEVEPADLPWLYRGAGFAAAGVSLGGGTDAPFGEPDPWAAMRAAVDRRSAAGEQLAAAEGLSPERALALFTTSPAAPGGAPQRLQVGAPANLCLLDRPWHRVRDELSAAAVRATLCGGEVVWDREAGSDG